MASTSFVSRHLTHRCCTSLLPSVPTNGTLSSIRARNQKQLPKGCHVSSKRTIVSTVQKQNRRYICKIYSRLYKDQTYFNNSKPPCRFTSVPYRQIFSKPVDQYTSGSSTNDMRTSTVWEAAVASLFAIGVSVGLMQYYPSNNLLLYDCGGRFDKTLIQNGLNGGGGNREDPGTFATLGFLSTSPIGQENCYFESSLKGEVGIGFHQPRSIQEQTAPSQEKYLRQDTYQRTRPYDVSRYGKILLVY
jgi:hypothetical protein